MKHLTSADYQFYTIMAILFFASLAMAIREWRGNRK
jgi:hypothetical protein